MSEVGGVTSGDAGIRFNERQCRAARAWLGLSRRELAERTGVSERTIHNFETGISVPYPRTMRVIREVFESEGIAFVYNGHFGIGIQRCQRGAAVKDSPEERAAY